MSNDAVNLDPEANVIFFLHDRLEPALQAATSINSAGSVAAFYSNLELLESFLWLHLGVTNDYFPQPLARRVAYEYAVPILKAYEAIMETRRSETWLAQPMRNILSEEFSGRAPLLNIPERPAVPQLINLPTTFQNVFLLSNGFAQQEQTARVVAAISIANERIWQKPIAIDESGGFPLDEEPDIQMLNEGLSWSHRGFFQMVEYIKAVPQVHGDALNAFEERSEQKKQPPNSVQRGRDALDRFFEQVKQVQQWRLNFSYPDPRERFLQIARNVAESSVQWTSPDEAPYEVVSGFQAEIARLLQYWGAPQSKSAGA